MVNKLLNNPSLASARVGRLAVLASVIVAVVVVHAGLEMVREAGMAPVAAVAIAAPDLGDVSQVPGHCGRGRGQNGSRAGVGGSLWVGSGGWHGSGGVVGVLAVGSGEGGHDGLEAGECEALDVLLVVTVVGAGVVLDNNIVLGVNCR